MNPLDKQLRERLSELVQTAAKLCGEGRATMATFSNLTRKFVETLNTGAPIDLRALCVFVEELAVINTGLALAFVTEYLCVLILRMFCESGIQLPEIGLATSRGSFQRVYAGPGGPWLLRKEGVPCMRYRKSSNEISSCSLLIPGHASETLLVGLADSEGDNNGVAFAAPIESSVLSLGEKVELIGLDDMDPVLLEADVVPPVCQCVLFPTSGTYRRTKNSLHAEASVLCSAVCLGIARACLEWAMGYSRRRVTFGKPIGQHQAVSLRLADSSIQLETARHLLFEMSVKDFSAMNEVSEYVFESALESGLNSARVLGGHGYLKLYPIESWIRDLQTLKLLARDDPRSPETQP